MADSELTEIDRREVEGMMRSLLSEFEESVVKIEADFREGCRDIAGGTSDKERV